MRKFALGAVICLAWAGCGLLGGGTPAQEVERAPVQVSATSVGVVDVEATRRAGELEAKRKEDAALLASSAVSGGAAPAGVIPGERQATARAVLGETLAGESREGPGRGG